MIGALLAGVLSIVASEVLYAGAFVGLGLAFRRVFGAPPPDLDDCFASFWVGFALVLGFLLLWNFAFPVDGRAALVVLLVGYLSLFWTGPWLRAAVAAERSARSRWLVVVAGVAILWLADQGIGPLTNWDSSLYHIQGVQWASQYPVVPGLANLYGPLGFNNSIFLYFAMLGTGPWTDRGFHLGNALLLSAFTVQVLAAGARFLSSDARGRPVSLFMLLLLPLALDWTLRGRVASYTTDLGKSLLIMELVLRWFSGSVWPRDVEHEGYDVLTIILLAAAAVTLKLNAVVFAGLAVIVVTARWLRQPGVPSRLSRRTLGWAVTASVLMGIAWGARGVVLSGYPAFPSRVLAFPVSWRAPAEHADAEFAYIQHSSQGSVQNGPVVAGQAGIKAWLPNWVRVSVLNDPFAAVVPAVLVVVLAGATAVRRGRPGFTPLYRFRTVAPIVATVSLSLISWFILSPEVRYVSHHFWVLAAAFGADRLAQGPDPGPGRRRALVGAIVALALMPLVVQPMLDSVRLRRPIGPFRAVVDENLKRPPRDGWFHPIARVPPIDTFVTRSGLVLNVPRGNAHCWAAPLPCTSNPAPNLELRVPGDLAGGFRVRGEWAMVDWPYRWRSSFLPAWRLSRHSSRP